MKLGMCLLLPTEEHLAQNSAVRKYQQISSQLAELGIDTEIASIDSLQNSKDLRHDIYVFCKCHDARVFLQAETMRRKGKLVGLYLVDDCYSQLLDSRLMHLREWLQTAVSVVDFCLCATTRIGEVIAGLSPDAKVHILGDVSEGLDAVAVGEAVDRKVEAAANDRLLRVAWFGLEENSYFHTGIHNLQAYAQVLNDLQGGGMEVRLEVLANKALLDEDRLALLARLPVQFEVNTWTPEREKMLLDKSLVAFAPVSGHSFSIAKSLDRAIVALSSGVQVLSPGYPLYQRLGEFVYSNAQRLLLDLERRSMRLGPQTLSRFENVLAGIADPRYVARRLSEFLHRLERPNVSREDPTLPAAQVIGILHGYGSTGELHKRIQKWGHLSIGGPFSNEKLNYDVRFVAIDSNTAVEVQVEKKHLALLAAAYRGRTTEGTSATGRAILRLALDSSFERDAFMLLDALSSPSRIIGIVVHRDVMHSMMSILLRLFPGISLYPSGAALQ